MGRMLVVCVLICFYGVVCRSYTFDHFVFAQNWPPSFCKHLGEKCYLPKNVTTWIVHGLWPSKGSEHLPVDCNKSSVFDYHKIETILDEMWKYWPNMNTTSEPFSFWAHEWVKHGTCAAQKPDLNTEFKYFSKSLTLRSKLSVYSALEKSSIFPTSSDFVKVNDVKAALQKYFGSYSTSISCIITDKDKNQQYLEQVEVCLDQDNYTPISCPVKDKKVYGSLATYCEIDCSCSETLLYPPFNEK